MIISHRYRFIFIKTRKTAGTSIEAFLSEVCAADDILTPLIPPVSPHRPRNFDGFFAHVPGSVIAAKSPPAWREYYKFCVERNPWDKVLSAYFMYRNSPVHGGDGALSLDQYLAAGVLPANEPLDAIIFPLNVPLYTIEGKIAVDRVLRYENLEAELSEVR